MSAKDLLSKLDEITRSPNTAFNPNTLGNWMRSAPLPQCKSVVAAIKSIIKKNKVSPQGKLNALKVFCACMRTNNPEFVRAAEEKVVRRLGILAAHNKVREM